MPQALRSGVPDYHLLLDGQLNDLIRLGQKMLAELEGKDKSEPGTITSMNADLIQIESGIDAIRNYSAMLPILGNPGPEKQVIFELVYNLVVGTYRIAGSARLPLWADRDVSERRAKHAGHKRLEKNKSQKDQLRDAIVWAASAGGSTLIATEKYAGSIRADVLRKLGLPDNAKNTSIRTISRAITDILKECGEDGRQS